MTELTPEEGAELSAKLDTLYRSRALQAYWDEPPGESGASDPQRAFHSDMSDFRMVLWPNKVGKTYAFGGEMWGLLNDSHPYDSVEHPTTFLVAVPDLDKSYADDLCTVLREMEPAGILADGCRYEPSKGYLVGPRRGIETARGDRVIFRSSHQALTGLAGVAAHRLFVNEPTAQFAWGELIRSVSETGGRVAVLFTAAQDMRRPEGHQWMKTEIAGDDEITVPRGQWSVMTPRGWSFHNFELSVDTWEQTCPHRSRERVQRQIDVCPIYERDQRILARWDAPTVDRRLASFDKAKNCCGDEVVPADAHLMAGMDHGERPGAETFVLCAHWERDGKRYSHQYLEYDAPGRTTSQQDADNIKDAVEALGFSLDAIREGKGDTNSAGKNSDLRTMNQVYMQDFARALGRDPRDRPFAIVAPDKGPGSVDYGLKTLDRAFAEGRATINPRCRGIIHSCEHYRGGKTGPDGELSHRIDAKRYVDAEWLDQTDHNADRRQWRKRTSQRLSNRAPESAVARWGS